MKVLLFLSIATILLTGCSGPDTEATPKITNGDTRVRRGDFRDVVQLTGEIEAADGVGIAVPRVPNWQTSIKTLIADGTSVKAGDVLTELDSTAFSTGLEQKRLARADAEQKLVQQLARAAAELEQKSFEVERTRIEVEKARSKADIPSDVLPRRDYEENQLALHKAEISYEKARTDLDSQRGAADAESSNLRIEIAKADREITTAEEAIESMIVRAPVAGVVVIQEDPNTARKFQIGDSVWVGMTMMMITNLDTLGVQAILFDVDDRKAELGQKAELTLDAYPETKLTGTITRVTNVANTLARNSLRRGFNVSITIDGEAPPSLRPGFSVRVTVIRKELRDVLLVSRSALDLSGAEPKAHLKNRSSVAVKLGDCNAHDCVVLSGLEEGQQLARMAPSRSAANHDSSPARLAARAATRRGSGDRAVAHGFSRGLRPVRDHSQAPQGRQNQRVAHMYDTEWLYEAVGSNTRAHRAFCRPSRGSRMHFLSGRYPRLKPWATDLSPLPRRRNVGTSESAILSTEVSPSECPATKGSFGSRVEFGHSGQSS